MGSTRLPGKVLMPIGDMPLLEHILCRLEILEISAFPVVATTTLPQDDAIEEFCRKKRVSCFRGSRENVLERYVRCAEKHEFDQVVRLTGDNPFTDMEELEALVSLHLKEGADFSHSFASLPVGVGAEVFTLDALRESLAHASLPHHFEHVDEYMLEHPEMFRTLVHQAPETKRYPELRLTVDTPEDYERACAIVNALGSDIRALTTERIVKQCLRSA